MFKILVYFYYINGCSQQITMVDCIWCV